MFLFLVPAFCMAQRLPALTIDQLDARIANGSDTTYIINFWATWCVPCLEEMPAFEGLRKRLKNEKVKILLVNVDVK
ncbi:MAG TPA: TlpA disulfide reductase family protein, partial [Chitinophagaceae bacterium]|nr:TlpA disulfide reductase family protein [Chitinophagaceae bacterium]